MNRRHSWMLTNEADAREVRCNCDDLFCCVSFSFHWGYYWPVPVKLDQQRFSLAWVKKLIKNRRKNHPWKTKVHEAQPRRPDKRYNKEQIIYALRQVEGGRRIAEVCRELGVSEQTYHRWKGKYAGMGISELRRLKQLDEENSSLKKLVADLSLDKHMVQEVIAKKL